MAVENVLWHVDGCWEKNLPETQMQTQNGNHTPPKWQNSSDLGHFEMKILFFSWIRMMRCAISTISTAAAVPEGLRSSEQMR